MTNNLKRYYTIKDVMEKLHASYYEVRSLIHKHNLNVSKDRRIRVDKKGLEILIYYLG